MRQLITHICKPARVVLLIWVCVCTCSYMPLHAQDWHLVESGVTSNLYDIQFVDKNTGWAVGEDSTIIKTTDGGHTWFRQTGGVAVQYRCLFFLDENNGWIGGDDGYLLKTNNGGDVWGTLRIPDVASINGISFADANTGWIATTAPADNFSLERGHILKTINGGHDWISALTTPVRVVGNPDSTFRGIYHDVDFIDTLNGCACGEIAHDVSRNLGSVVCTSDGGGTWEHITIWQSWVASYRLSMVSYDTVVAATRVGIARTINRGKTYWEPFQPFSSVFDVAIPNTDYIFALGQFAGEINVRQYIAGAEEPIFQRLEGSPRFVDDNNRGLFMGLFMFDTTSGWICGNGGQLWSKTNKDVSVEFLGPHIPRELYITTMYPNPQSACQSTQSLSVVFTVSYECTLNFEMYNILGEKLISVNYTDTFIPGIHTKMVTVPRIHRGTYYCRLTSIPLHSRNGINSTTEVLLIR